MAKLRISLACCDYDRTRALFDGRASVDGCELIATAIEFPALRVRERAVPAGTAEKCR